MITNELEERRDFELPLDIRLTCGERFRHLVEDYDFVLQLRTPEKLIEFTKESYDLLVQRQYDVCKCIQDKDRAIIFQEIEVQVWVYEYDHDKGYQVHFEDKNRTRISMDKYTFKILMSLCDALEDEYAKYNARKNARKRKASDGKDKKSDKETEKSPTHRLLKRLEID